MRTLKRWTGVALGVLALGTGVWLFAGEPNEASRRERANKAFRAGNFKDAYEDYRRLVLDPKADARKVGADLYQGIRSLQRLGRSPEIDAFREAGITAQAKNWRFLQEAARSYVDPSIESFG